MSYLDNIKKDGRYANPFFCLMGIEVVTVEPGRAFLKMQVRPDMQNGSGWLQGGMLAAIADEAMALALSPLLSKTEGIATISESTSFVRGIQEGMIFAEGRVIRKGRRVAFTEGEVYTGCEERIMLSRTSAAFAITTQEK